MELIPIHTHTDTSREINGIRIVQTQSLLGYNLCCQHVTLIVQCFVGQNVRLHGFNSKLLVNPLNTELNPICQ